MERMTCDVTWAIMVLVTAIETVTRTTPRRVSPSLPANQRSGPWQRWPSARLRLLTVNIGTILASTAILPDNILPWLLQLSGTRVLRHVSISSNNVLCFQVKHVWYGTSAGAVSSTFLDVYLRLRRLQTSSLHPVCRSQLRWWAAVHGDSAPDSAKQYQDDRRPPHVQLRRGQPACSLDRLPSSCTAAASVHVARLHITIQSQPPQLRGRGQEHGPI